MHDGGRHRRPPGKNPNAANVGNSAGTGAAGWPRYPLELTMPDPTTEIACTAAVDLPDVRCASPTHPHRGAHHRTLTLPDGTFVSVIWNTRGQDGAKDQELDRELPHHRVDVPDDAPAPTRLPHRLRRSDYTQTLVPL
jgi:hypothetical protein